MKKGQTFSKTYAGQIMRQRKIEEVGTLLDHILNEQWMSAKMIKMEFCIDYKTIKALRNRSAKVSGETLAKFCYVLAFYITQRKHDIETRTKFLVGRDERLAEHGKVLNHYKSIYGIEATFCLELIQQEQKDLREIVNYEKRISN